MQGVNARLEMRNKYKKLIKEGYNTYRYTATIILTHEPRTPK